MLRIAVKLMLMLRMRRVAGKLTFSQQLGMLCLLESRYTDR
jgi:hypothetical protein